MPHPPIYLDYAATAPARPEAVRAAAEAAAPGLGNPPSIHWAGRLARGRVEAARREVAALVEAAPDEILFTSGGTEANNLALKGALAAPGGPRRLITSAVEHRSVVETARDLASRGREVLVLPV